MESLADLSDLKARLEWVLTDDEERLGTSALEDLSDDARGYGIDTWDPTTVPRQVRKAVLSAAVRYLRNPEGYVQSRAGDETVTWADLRRAGGSASFEDDEIRLIQSYAGRNDAAIQSVPVVAWNSLYSDEAGYVPTIQNGQIFPLFPFFASETDEY